MKFSLNVLIVIYCTKHFWGINALIKLYRDQIDDHLQMSLSFAQDFNCEMSNLIPIKLQVIYFQSTNLESIWNDIKSLILDGNSNGF